MSAQQESRLLALPLVVCLFNLAAPYLFRGLAALELQESPVLEVYVAICRCARATWLSGVGDPAWLPGLPFSSNFCPHRNLILKMVTLGILCYHWLGRRVEALQDQVRAAWTLASPGSGLVGGLGCPARGGGGEEWSEGRAWPGAPVVGPWDGRSLEYAWPTGLGRALGRVSA